MDETARGHKHGRFSCGGVTRHTTFIGSFLGVIIIKHQTHTPCITHHAMDAPVTGSALVCLPSMLGTGVQCGGGAGQRKEAARWGVTGRCPPCPITDRPKAVLVQTSAWCG